VPRRPREDAHDALLEAAREAFARAGLERARVEDIARRAGVSKGAFYLHFDSKEDAFRELVQRLLGALEEHVRRRIETEDRLRADPSRTATEAFEAECHADVELLELLWRNRQIVSAVDGAAPKESRELFAGFRRRMRALVAQRIVERQSAGALRRDVDPEVFGDIVVGSYEDLARRMADMRERPDLAAWVRSLLVVLYEGILERPGAPLPLSAAARR
jgi:AcrR family transcriptional regulator